MLRLSSFLLLFCINCIAIVVFILRWDLVVGGGYWDDSMSFV